MARQRDHLNRDRPDIAGVFERREPPAFDRGAKGGAAYRRAADPVLDDRRETAARHREQKWAAEGLGEGWQQWWDAAQQLLAAGRAKLDPYLVTVGVRFVSTVMQLASLLDKVRNFRGQTAQIEKAAEALGYSKPSAYNWIKWAGLDPADFLNAADNDNFDRAMSHLIAKGDSIGLLLDEVMEQYKKLAR
jgi:hypothetical protein